MRDATTRSEYFEQTSQSHSKKVDILLEPGDRLEAGDSIRSVSSFLMAALANCLAFFLAPHGVPQVFSHDPVAVVAGQVALVPSLLVQFDTLVVYGFFALMTDI